MTSKECSSGRMECWVRKFFPLGPISLQMPSGSPSKSCFTGQPEPLERARHWLFLHPWPVHLLGPSANCGVVRARLDRHGPRGVGYPLYDRPSVARNVLATHVRRCIGRNPPSGVQLWLQPQSFEQGDRRHTPTPFATPRCRKGPPGFPGGPFHARTPEGCSGVDHSVESVSMHARGCACMPMGGCGVFAS